MAEDLTDYLLEAGVKTRYLHSEVDTLERIQIIRELRLGDYDVLVGVNLLREGLDLPEVSLVAILDADKEGFLRGKTALIQTIGRAARHVDGRVLMYADKETEAIRGALEETNRRRVTQLAYNEENGITPISITKGVSDIAEFLALEQPHVPNSRRRGGKKVEGLDREELEKLLVTLEEEMFQAAEELRFEYAAKLRDEIKEIRRDLNALVGTTDGREPARSELRLCRGGSGTMSLGFVLAIVVSGFVTGGLARFALPGPDPMPIWLTIAIGLTGSIVGAVVGRAISGDDNGYVVSFLSFGVAIALVAAYRRFVQHRPIFGPGAMAFPQRGIGVAGTRQKLRSLGFDPDAMRRTPRAARAGTARGDAARAASRRRARRRRAAIEARAFDKRRQRRSSSHALGMAHHRRPHRRCARTGASSGQDPLGWLLTLALGVVSLIIAGVIFSNGVLEFIVGIVIAAVLLAIWARMAPRTAALGSACGRAGTSARPSAPTRHRRQIDVSTVIESSSAL